MDQSKILARYRTKKNALQNVWKSLIMVNQPTEPLWMLRQKKSAFVNMAKLEEAVPLAGKILSSGPVSFFQNLPCLLSRYL